ncbi:hypothetical protein OERS_03870 [Oerskovia enterophila]|uniref:Uncharacterized protein n=1 Tax=Oerskovia enterophila TaxID=43678 RepID=A0ABX2Y8H5_9CELL|nr:hypothetical protein OERS_03870 [Oerskovia enterophila]
MDFSLLLVGCLLVAAVAVVALVVWLAKRAANQR